MYKLAAFLNFQEFFNFVEKCIYMLGVIPIFGCPHSRLIYLPLHPTPEAVIRDSGEMSDTFLLCNWPRVQALLYFSGSKTFFFICVPLGSLFP